MDLGQWIVIGLSVGMVAWFFGVSSYNRQREEKVFRWIYRGLKRYGEPEPVDQKGPRSRLPGLEVSKANGPFHRVQVKYLLERRENPPLWIFQRLKGMRDELEVRLVFKAAARIRIFGDDPDKLKAALGPYSSALQENGVSIGGRELLLQFYLKELLDKEAEDFFDTLKDALGG